MTYIFTHRGLDPDEKNFPFESSMEAFRIHIQRGYCVEFDPNFTKDGIIVWHDANAKRLYGSDELLKDVSSKTIIEQAKQTNGFSVPTIEEFFTLLNNSDVPLHALHLKAAHQTPEKVAKLVDAIKQYAPVEEKLLIFDLKPDTAKILKKQLPKVKLVASVAHSYDIKRYGEVVGNTLLSLEEVKNYTDLYDWVWLDEWDLQGPQNTKKQFYTQKIFDECRSLGYKIALVTPELHGTSPGLYGGESHADAATSEKLFTRIKEILDLEPDAICTDHPDASKKLDLN